MRNYLLAILLIVLLGCAREPDGRVTSAPTAVSTPTLSPTATTTPTELVVATATAVDQPPTPFPTPTIPPAPTPILYTIQEGETLLGIAIAQGTTTEAILALNPELVPQALSIGQVIVLPPITAVSEAPIDVHTAVPASLTVSQVQTYQTVVGSFWVVGEVANAGEQAVENVQVAVRFLNDAGEEVDTAVAWAANPIVAAGESAPFGMLLPQKPSYAQLHTTVSQGNVVSDLGERYVDLAVSEVILNNEQPAAQVSGVVQNVGVDTAVAVQLLITLYDSEDYVVGFLVRPLAAELAAGDEVQFTKTAVSLAAPIEQVQIAAFAYKAPAE